MEWTQAPVLEGELLRLEALGPQHAAGLFAIADQATFDYLLRAPEPFNEEGFHEYVEERCKPGSWGYAIFDKASDRIVGHSSYIGIGPEHRHIEVGHTWYAPEARGTRVNPECKLIMVGHAFETLDCVRVQLKCDARNARSRAAITKLGAQFEGVQRSNLILQNGHIRDTAYFSIIKEEWPVVKAGLLARLK
jgi:RimJ/RimL family protein N-acetyltransferase